MTSLDIAAFVLLKSCRHWTSERMPCGHTTLQIINTWNELSAILLSPKAELSEPLQNTPGNVSKFNSHLMVRISCCSEIYISPQFKTRKTTWHTSKHQWSSASNSSLRILHTLACCNIHLKSTTDFHHYVMLPTHRLLPPHNRPPPPNKNKKDF